jgi:hypothetical protein
MSEYWIDGDLIRFVTSEKKGFFHKDYEGIEMSEYLAWVAEGNTAEEWSPNGNQ